MQLGILIGISFTCVPPGVSVKLELFRANDQLAVDCFDDTTDQNYHAPKVVIVNASLHVPIGTLGKLSLCVFVCESFNSFYS